MLFSTVIYACLFLLSYLAAAQFSYKTNSLCTTLYGTKSVSPKSTGYKLTIPITYTRKTTITPKSTITPPPAVTTTTSVTTQTQTDTTTPTETITTTSEATFTITSTEHTTSTAFATTTSTSTPAAITIPTSAGFTPLANSPDYVPKKRSDADLLPAIRGRAPALIKCPPIKGGGQFTPRLYPSSTICGTLVQAITTTTKTFTASTTSTSTLPTSTRTETSISTTTTTITVAGAPVLTTTAITTTTTATATTTVTDTTSSTITLTLVAPSPTAYAQCQSNNVIGAANGNQGIYQPGYVPYNGVAINQVSINDATQCCVTCAQAVGCVGYSLYPGGPCYYYTVAAASCDGSNTFDDQFTSSAGVAPGQGYVIGNGQCGRFANAGSV